MLEDKKYGYVLNKLKKLPNPSDKDDQTFDDKEDAPENQTGHKKFIPADYDSDGEEGAVPVSLSGSGTSSQDDSELGLVSNAPGRKGPKKKLTKAEAIELFTQLIKKETKLKSGGSDDNSDKSAQVAEGESDEDDEVEEAVKAEYTSAWEEYCKATDRIPGDRPRPSLHRGPASMTHGSTNDCSLRDHRVQAGCTSVVVFVVDNLLYCANAGDSRAVLCRADGNVLALSEDHKPSQEIESSRIANAGGFVNIHGRVNGNLNLSRSLGDMKYKQVPDMLPKDQIITAEPDISVTELMPGDKFLVLACDGVWDVLGNQEICDFVSDRLAQKMSIKDIISDVFSHCVADDPKQTQGIGGDNMTCMIVLLNE
jgi:serine/threonine protein phosphatase PrpC